MAEKSNDGRKVMGAIDWCLEISIIAGPMLANETRESWLARTARKAGVTFRQCKALYYGETDDPKVSVAYGVLAAAAKARREARLRVDQLESLAAKMNAANQTLNSNLVGDEIVALIQEAQRLRNQSSA